MAQHRYLNGRRDLNGRRRDQNRSGPRKFSPRFEDLENRLLLATNVLTYHYDNARDGANTAETTLTPSNVNSADFGKEFSLPTDGLVYAQPLLMTGVTIPGQGTRNVLYVATENDSVYAFDAQGNNPAQGYLWKDSLIPPGETTQSPADINNPNDIITQIGITSTPVIDPTTNALYVVAATELGSGSTATFIWRLHALDLATGAEKFGGPVVINPSVPGTGDGGTTDTFGGQTQLERAGLALVNGVVYVTFASHGDVLAPYQGWVVGYNASTLQQVSVFNDDPNAINGGGSGRPATRPPPIPTATYTSSAATARSTPIPAAPTTAIPR